MNSSFFASLAHLVLEVTNATVSTNVPSSYLTGPDFFALEIFRFKKNVGLFFVSFCFVGLVATF